MINELIAFQKTVLQIIGSIRNNAKYMLFFDISAHKYMVLLFISPLYTGSAPSG
jgi:hypothetical protein